MNDAEQGLVMQLATLRHQVVQTLGDAQSSDPIYPMMITDFERKRAERTCFLLMNIACSSLDALPSELAPSHDVVSQLLRTYAEEIQALQVAVDDASLAGLSDDAVGQILIDVFVKE
jgi:hypothetical protein